VWDLRYAPPAGFPRTFPMQAIYRDTPSTPEGPLAQPGSYQVRLTVDGKAMRQQLELKPDPRVSTPLNELAEQHALSLECYDGIAAIRTAQAEMRKLREQLKTLQERAGQTALGTALANADKQVQAFDGRSSGLDAFGGTSREPGLAGLSGNLLGVMNAVQAADRKPTTQLAAAVADLKGSLNELLGRWQEFKTRDVKTLNNQLRQAGLPALAL